MLAPCRVLPAACVLDTAKLVFKTPHSCLRLRRSHASMSNDHTVRCQDQPCWRSLGTPPQQLLLHNTLPTGQSFRWRLTEPDTYTGVIGQRVVQLRQLQDDVKWQVLARGPGSSPDADAAALHDYFNLGIDLAAFYSEWAERDERFWHIAPALPGARMLRQDPVECMFEFICSSNNHISRIHGMVERLCSTYGSELMASGSSSSSSSNSNGVLQLPKSSGATQHTPEAKQPPTSSQQPALKVDTMLFKPLPDDAVDLPFSGTATAAAAVPASSAATSAIDSSSPSSPEACTAAAAAASQGALQQQQLASAQAQLAFYAFPTLQQLSAATEEALRADGFGYRAKFIVGSVQQLMAKPEGGEAWLHSLRSKPYAEAHAALCSLPGIGPKVAACICLFSLDKHDAIPVDTHVWTLATKYYAPHLAKKTLNKGLHAEVQQVFVARFGPYAGWAHNTLFVSELASHRHLLPAGLAAAAAGAVRSSSGGGAVAYGDGKVAAGAKGAGAGFNSSGGTHGKHEKGSKRSRATAEAAGTSSKAGAATAALPEAGSSGAAGADAAAAVAVKRSSRTRRRNRRYSADSSDSTDQYAFSSVE